MAVKTDKKILDACCGSRMFWFDKTNKDVLFCDIRTEKVEFVDNGAKGGIRIVDVKPDLECDFRDMPFSDNSFKMVVFDPPHLKTLGKTSLMAKKYGKLENSWEHDIKAGFDECMRVLEPHGTLIFKWNATEIKVPEILKAIEKEPLFGHKSGKRSNTHWLCFMKM